MVERIRRAASPTDKKPTVGSGMSELGVTGLKAYSGIVYEEYHRDLQGRKAVEVFKRMSDSDPTVGSCLMAFFLILRAVDWRTEPAPDSGAAGEAEAEFVDSLFQDMSHTWEDFLSETLTMLTYGWHYAEIVTKRRVGPTEVDPSKRSKYTDGRIGIRKLAPRSQDTLWKWDFQEDGGISGLWQWSPTMPKHIYIPIEKSLLFRTTSNKNNPEGRSVLRNAYRSWQRLTVIEDAEAIGVERELAGLPVAYVPSRYLTGTGAAEVSFKNAVQKLVRDLKFNEQAGVVLPSDPYKDSEGDPTNIPQVKLELLNSGGARTINTTDVAMRHQRSIARSMLADFLMLGQDKGAFNLGESKTNLFYRAAESVIGQIAAPINQFLIPRIWALNGLDYALMPTRVPGKVAPADLQGIGEFLLRRSAAGDTLFPDPVLTEFLNELADLPAPSVELMDQLVEDGSNTGELPDDRPDMAGEEDPEDVDEEDMVKFEKGEREGHPFRGNQYTQGVSDRYGLDEAEQDDMWSWQSGVGYNKLRNDPAFAKTLEKFPRFSGTVYRGLELGNEKQWSKLVSGSTFKIDKLSSASTNKLTASAFASGKIPVMMEFDVRDAAKIPRVYNQLREQEVVLSKGSRFKITDIKERTVDGEPVRYVKLKQV